MLAVPKKHCSAPASLVLQCKAEKCFPTTAEGSPVFRPFGAKLNLWWAKQNTALHPQASFCAAMPRT
eukprot:4393247-Alexandrium_andersonii.AAC.1